jgi:hypothetical protein
LGQQTLHHQKEIAYKRTASYGHQGKYSLEFWRFWTCNGFQHFTRYTTTEHLLSIDHLLFRANLKNTNISGFSFQKVKYYNESTNLCILRSPRDQFRMVWAALTFITQIENAPLLLRVIHVGGTLRSCQASAIKFDRKMLHLLKRLKSKQHKNIRRPSSSSSLDQSIQEELLPIDL